FDRGSSVFFISGPIGIVSRRAKQRHIVLYQDAILKNGYARRAVQGTVIIKPRCYPDDIIGLPGSRFPARVDQRWILIVDASGLPVGIRFMPITIQYLQFIARIAGPCAGQEYAAIAPG